jgi:hypothetical protein
MVQSAVVVAVVGTSFVSVWLIQFMYSHERIRKDKQHHTIRDLQKYGCRVEPKPKPGRTFARPCMDQPPCDKLQNGIKISRKMFFFFKWNRSKTVDI